jgi:cytochrome c5
VSQQVDKSVMTTTVILISGLVLLAVVLFMVAALLGVIGGVAPDDNSRKQAAVIERIKPVARVSFEQPKPAGAIKLSGVEVYNKVCAACHATGALGAPKTGAKDQWEARFAQGLDTLVAHSVNGIRAMPAKGGDPSLTEANIKDALVYMLGESGIKVEAAAPAAAAPAAAPAPVSAPAQAIPPPPVKVPAAAPPAFIQAAPTAAPARAN